LTVNENRCIAPAAVTVAPSIARSASAWTIVLPAAAPPSTTVTS
jgi:hypothetical protein